MLEQAGSVGPSVPTITARVAIGSPPASFALSGGGAGCEQPASASAQKARTAGPGRRAESIVMRSKLAAAARARNAPSHGAERRIFAWVLPPSTLYDRHDGPP